MINPWIQLLFIFIGSILGGFISGVVGIAVANRNRCRVAKDAFAAFIQQKVSGLRKGRELKFYNDTKIEIRGQVLTLMHYLPAKQKVGIENVWKNYDSIKQGQLNARATMAFASDAIRQQTEERSPYEIVADSLKNFYLFAE